VDPGKGAFGIRTCPAYIYRRPHRLGRVEGDVRSEKLLVARLARRRAGRAEGQEIHLRFLPRVEARVECARVN